MIYVQWGGAWDDIMFDIDSNELECMIPAYIVLLQKQALCECLYLTYGLCWQSYIFTTLLFNTFIDSFIYIRIV